MDPYSEIELKFEAKSVNTEHFLKWAIGLSPVKYIHVKCPDFYYRQGDNVVRHRLSEGAGQLTVKNRKRTDSTTDRVEVDIDFGGNMSHTDVERFLLVSGWEIDLSLQKDAHVFWFEDVDFISTLSIYTVTDSEYIKRTFVEVEIEKSSNIDTQEALYQLNEWEMLLKEEFGLNDPIDQSLYEIFTGDMYKLNVKK